MPGKTYIETLSFTKRIRWRIYKSMTRVMWAICPPEMSRLINATMTQRSYEGLELTPKNTQIIEKPDISFWTYFNEVTQWFIECFGYSPSSKPGDRLHRFTEESLELTQSLGQTREEAHAIVDYVHGRPVGEPVQELGGTFVTLFVVAETYGLNPAVCARKELDRVKQPSVMTKIRAKDAAKPVFSALPGQI